MNDDFDNDMEDFSFSNIINEDAEFIPLLPTDEDDFVNLKDIPEVLSILSVRNTVLFPGVVIPITVSRDKSIKLIQEAYSGNRIIGVASQKDDKIEDPEVEDLNIIGTVAYIVKILRMPDGNTTVIIQGKKRFSIEKMVQTNPYFKANISLINDVKPKGKDKKFEALISSLKDLALQIVKKSPNIPTEASFAIKNIESSSFLINFISSNMNTGLLVPDFFIF